MTAAGVHVVFRITVGDVVTFALLGAFLLLVGWVAVSDWWRRRKRRRDGGGL